MTIKRSHTNKDHANRRNTSRFTKHWWDGALRTWKERLGQWFLPLTYFCSFFLWAPNLKLPGGQRDYTHSPSHIMLCIINIAEQQRPFSIALSLGQKGGFLFSRKNIFAVYPVFIIYHAYVHVCVPTCTLSGA